MCLLQVYNVKRDDVTFKWDNVMCATDPRWGKLLSFKQSLLNYLENKKEKERKWTTMMEEKYLQ